jgi:hypothetical protein
MAIRKVIRGGLLGAMIPPEKATKDDARESVVEATALVEQRRIAALKADKTKKYIVSAEIERAYCSACGALALRAWEKPRSRIPWFLFGIIMVPLGLFTVGITLLIWVVVLFWGFTPQKFCTHCGTAENRWQ